MLFSALHAKLFIWNYLFFITWYLTFALLSLIGISLRFSINFSGQSARFVVKQSSVDIRIFFPNSGKNDHSGAGAQASITIVFCLLSKFCTFDIAFSASCNTFPAHSTASFPVSFSEKWFLPRSNNATPKSSSIFFILRVIDGCDILNFSATFDNVSYCSKAMSWRPFAEGKNDYFNTPALVEIGKK